MLKIFLVTVMATIIYLHPTPRIPKKHHIPLDREFLNWLDQQEYHRIDEDSNKEMFKTAREKKWTDEATIRKMEEQDRELHIKWNQSRY